MINTGHFINEILYKLLYVYLARYVPNLPMNSRTRFFIDENGLINTKHNGLKIFPSFFFFNNYKATPVPIDLPITITCSSINPNFLVTN
jgi:hypothetical protein